MLSRCQVQSGLEKRPSINAKPSPQAAPESASLAVCASVIEIIARLPALSAIRSPNSRVRCATEKEIAP